jgi:ketosteroid isomerase-like protein
LSGVGSNQKDKAVERRPSWLKLVLAGVVSLCLNLPSLAVADTTANDVRAQIVATLGAITSSLSRGDSVEKVTKMLYTSDSLILEPGEPPSRGLQSALKAMQVWEDSLGPGGVKDCKFTVIDPVVSTSTTFSSFLYLTCKSNGVTTHKDMQLRLLYVWERRPEGWRVILESVQEGAFP